MTGLYLSRLTMHRDLSLAAIAPVLLPAEDGARIHASHRLIWAAFAESESTRRDFLWREEKTGQFLVLSRRLPNDPHGLFKVEPKEFAPVLAPGARLCFALRANAVVTRKAADGKPKRHDIVMDALRNIPKGPERAKERDRLALECALAWLCRQGEQAGFRPDEESLTVHYRPVRLPGRKGSIDLGVLDLEGSMTVENPALLLDAISKGFGKARGFGCGLMLIRRHR
jgi:CRISPR system Cascade subunit CasE